ncbi:Nuclear speckle splicing regulatory protein 1 [Nowakowskiella sp. JEL0407]|nr:Nuclear speckle splicing regulatory protein 1 [Nowakowskiella sp. JEL0407]
MQKFGLSIPKKAGHIVTRTLTPQKKKSSIFEDNDDDNETYTTDKITQELTALQELKSKQVSKIHERAIEEDPTVFDYDGHYEAFKQAEILKRKERDGVIENGKKKARYISEMKSSTNRRQLEFERVKERTALREREQEDASAMPTEKFVTAAFKERQLELKRLEEEELRKEEEDKKRLQADPLGFYRNMLDSTTSVGGGFVNDEALKKAKEEMKREEEEKQTLLKDAIKEGRVRVNDAEELVDKRQLLKAGLNISAKKLRQMEIEKEEKLKAEQLAMEKREAERKEREERIQKAENLARQRALHAQHVSQQQQILEREMQAKKEAEKQALAERMKSNVTEDTVNDARARYLARKRAENDDDSD